MAGPCQGRSCFFFLRKNLNSKEWWAEKRVREKPKQWRKKETELDTLPRTDLTLSLTTHVCGVQVLEFWAETAWAKRLRSLRQEIQGDWPPRGVFAFSFAFPFSFTSAFAFSLPLGANDPNAHRFANLALHGHNSSESLRNAIQIHQTFPKPTPWSQTLPSSASLILQNDTGQLTQHPSVAWIKRLLVGCAKVHSASTQEVALFSFFDGAISLQCVINVYTRKSSAVAEFTTSHLPHPLAASHLLLEPC